MNANGTSAVSETAYSPNHVANAFLLKARNEGVRDVDPLKVQKLVYNLNGYWLAMHGAPLVGERFQAWRHGPVLASLYHQFKSNRASPISTWALDKDMSGEGWKAYRPSDEDRAFYDALEAVWDKYKSLSGLQLSALTHAPGTPWSKARQRGDDYLDNDEIREHFREVLQRAKG
ncbi:MAG: SocA family protein [Phenylobacterium sp.]|uniref:Panacea domain-containing protein n=1 Tax=Phenylobacterium sp. TaxID=1871053 RepID=UPI001A608290|nr:type II toxin-antitoxin system antitoxin SocA domain-containing protein [Phenylobacterium sp.]MBL8774262.1 SocA family protein [Phenylobacterium sp.]